jgi:hypothetical protein
LCEAALCEAALCEAALCEAAWIALTLNLCEAAPPAPPAWHAIVHRSDIDSRHDTRHNSNRRVAERPTS